MSFLYKPDFDSVLIPDQSQLDWTDTTQVLSNDVPLPAGITAAETAQDALGLSPSAAAQLVALAGATGLSPGDLARFIGYQARAVNPRGSNATRLPIPASVNTAVALVNGDPFRTFMIIQNNNAVSGGANLLVSVDGQITGAAAFYLNIAPGIGLLLDEEIFVNPVYVAWGSGTVAGGMVLFGSKAQPQQMGAQSQFLVGNPGPAH